MCEEDHKIRQRLKETYPFLFEGLSYDEVESRLDFFTRLYPGDIFEDIKKMLDAHRGAPKDPNTAAYERSIGLLLTELRRVCKKARCESVAEAVEGVVARLREAAEYGATEGEQRASMHYRYPDLLARREVDARRLRSGVDVIWPFLALRFVRQYERIHDEMASHIQRTKPKRAAVTKKDLSALLSRYPELGRKVKRPVDLQSLTPAQAALIVFGRRQNSCHQRSPRVESPQASAGDRASV